MKNDVVLLASRIVWLIGKIDAKGQPLADRDALLLQDMEDGLDMHGTEMTVGGKAAQRLEALGR